ncbi:hypothetical protein TELCIR_08833 [Teladorsagia circumcincta]|uniref:Uncharacterized protein n=1 Tax=Teladorsagia circumcincta TaxID=45464 RepID=A0A2G9UGH3_TELCI|nr:hypothetical protein TELCIR_08833 [Teladorsagia circumcincta]
MEVGYIHAAAFLAVSTICVSFLKCTVGNREDSHVAGRRLITYSCLPLLLVPSKSYVDVDFKAKIDTYKAKEEKRLASVRYDVHTMFKTPRSLRALGPPQEDEEKALKEEENLEMKEEMKSENNNIFKLDDEPQKKSDSREEKHDSRQAIHTKPFSSQAQESYKSKVIERKRVSERDEQIAEDESKKGASTEASKIDAAGSEKRSKEKTKSIKSKIRSKEEAKSSKSKRRSKEETKSGKSKKR